MPDPDAPGRLDYATPPKPKPRRPIVSRPFLWTIVVCLLLVLGIAVLLPMFGRAREIGNRVKCQINLGRLGQALAA